MSDELSDQQRKFADAVLKGMNQTDAYKAAGYKSKNDDVAAANASRLIGNEKVATYLEAKRTKVASKLEIDLEWLIRECHDLYSECRTEADRVAAGANIQRLAMLTGNWVAKQEHSGTITHEDRLERLREHLNGIRTDQPVTH